MTEVSQVQKLMSAINGLPPDGRGVISALYRNGLSEQQACVELRISPVELSERRSAAIRQLMSATV